MCVTLMNIITMLKFENIIAILLKLHNADNNYINKQSDIMCLTLVNIITMFVATQVNGYIVRN